MLTRRTFSKSVLASMMLHPNTSTGSGKYEFISNQNEIVVNIGECYINFVEIPAGYGIVGSRDALFLEKGQQPKFRAIEITKRFFISKFLLTESDKKALRDTGVLPPETITHQYVKTSPKSAASFGGWEMTPICLAFSKLLGAAVTLPTEAQWEYACRAGSETNFYNGDDEEKLKKIAWYRGNAQKDFSGSFIHPEIGLLEPNKFGLYDILGLMGEPCIDDISYTDATIDPIGRRSSPADFPRGDPRYYPMTVRGGHLVDPASRVTCHRSSKYWFGPFGPPPIGLRMVINDS